MKKLLILLLFFLSIPSNAQCIQSIMYSGYIDAEGRLFAWGSFNGQVQNGSEPSWVPSQVGATGEWKTLGALYYSKILAIKNDGTLWQWGTPFNAFGNPLGVEYEIPTQIGTDSDWETVSASQTHAIAIKSDGTLWGWGFNYDGQVGNNSYSTVPEPVKIGSDTDWKMVSAGGNFSAALKNDGTLWAWGGSSNYLTIHKQKTPIQIGTDADWLMIDSGNRFMVALKSDGTLWEWGFKGYANAVDGSNNYLWPTQTNNDTDWTYVDATLYKFYAIKENGALYYWGNAMTDGSDHLNNPNEATRFGNDNSWVKVTAGTAQTVAEKSDGSLWRWGIVSSEGTQAVYSYEAQLVNECENPIVEDPTNCNCECLFIANPVHDYASLLYDGSANVNEITVFDVGGKRISKTLENANAFYVGDLQQGIYFVEITCNGKSYTKKLLKL